jgi:hypothetical protein
MTQKANHKFWGNKKPPGGSGFGFFKVKIVLALTQHYFFTRSGELWLHQGMKILPGA